MSETATSQATLAICHKKGIVLACSGGTLTVNAPEGVLTPDLMAELRHHKADLLDVLQEGGSGPAVPRFDEPDNAVPSDILTDADTVPREECIELQDPGPKC